jgi:hypothetical protein
MSAKFLLAGLACAASLAAMGAAEAQPLDPACVRANQNNTMTGAVVGGVAGAVLGSAVAGHHEKTEGAVLGGVGGAVVGGMIANSNNHPCPEGYVYRAPPPPPARMAPPPPPAPGGFWYGAPDDVAQRIDFMQRRIDRGVQNGFIGPRDGRRFSMQLNNIRREEGRARYRDRGVLTPMDRDRIQNQLDNLSRRLHWEEHRDAWDRDGGPGRDHYDRDHDRDRHDWDRH